jgi:hypothetical protein
VYRSTLSTTLSRKESLLERNFSTVKNTLLALAVALFFGTLALPASFADGDPSPWPHAIAKDGDPSPWPHMIAKDGDPSPWPHMMQAR